MTSKTTTTTITMSTGISRLRIGQPATFNRLTSAGGAAADTVGTDGAWLAVDSAAVVGANGNAAGSAAAGSAARGGSLAAGSTATGSGATGSTAGDSGATG